ncbi:TIGR00266 family protein [Acetitomaculum ruminis DSM 5522]|uniref:TIGR00266 family protein n=1 Tax=Acetitomaculum ruminis DSM 5522 TaxID=1120918 RepID=A0A1I0VJ86_9FIRM|nr:TIGR00266 family protein [Acetitomaculum ruminis]SFA76454.1 TIGR00266 family protein [Acetitomaculum ruminis DSM 5522]
MQYEIKGTPLPVLEVQLEPGESINCEGGAMSWMSPNLTMNTTGGGLGKMFSKAFSGEKIFSNTYSAPKNQGGCIAFASSFPGNIIAVEVRPGQDIICQKSAYLASSSGVELSIFFQKKIGAGFFGGEGFIMQKLSGNGIAFLEIDGSVVTKELGAGEQILVDTGYLAMMDGSCTIDIQSVKGVKNMLLGGEGLFNTVVTGPGRVSLQTMPAYQMASSLSPFIATGGN